jgi:hypothetical protein
MELLSLDWYISPPIDFEQKQYMLYAYLQTVDRSFLKLKVSPHLLHLERLKDGMERFYQSFNNFEKELDARTYKWFDNPLMQGRDNQTLNEIIDIVDFSIPLVNGKILQGYKILKKNDNQLLY